MFIVVCIIIIIMTSMLEINDAETRKLAEYNIDMSYCHLILPRENRITIGISSARNDMDSSEFWLNIIQSSYNDTLVSILDVSKIGADENDSQKQNYRVIFMIIPHELINKIKEVGCKQFKAYIGLSEDNTDYKVLNKCPPISELATVNRNYEPMPYTKFMWFSGDSVLGCDIQSECAAPPPPGRGLSLPDECVAPPPPGRSPPLPDECAAPPPPG